MSTATDVDEIYNPYADSPASNGEYGVSDSSLVQNAAGYGGVKDYKDPGLRLSSAIRLRN